MEPNQSNTPRLHHYGSIIEGDSFSIVQWDSLTAVIHAGGLTV